MKLFEFKTYEEKDWVFAESETQALKLYRNETGSDLTTCEIREIHESKWDLFYIVDPNESEPDWDDEEDYNEDDYCSGYKIVETFKDLSKRLKAPKVILSDY